MKIVTEAYEEGLSSMDLIHWIKQNPDIVEEKKYDLIMHYQSIKAEYRCEKMLMYVLVERILCV